MIQQRSLIHEFCDTLDLRDDLSAQSFWFDKSMKFSITENNHIHLYIAYIHLHKFCWAIMLFTYHLQNTVDKSDSFDFFYSCFSSSSTILSQRIPFDCFFHLFFYYRFFFSSPLSRCCAKSLDSFLTMSF